MTEMEKAKMPAWFDAKTHRTAEGGIFETATGVLLGEDGAPFSAAVRLSRAGEPAAAAVKPARTRRPRGTETVLADHINAGAAAETTSTAGTSDAAAAGNQE